MGNAETNRVDLASGPAAQEARVSAGSDARNISCTCLGPLGSAASNKVDPDFSHTSPRSLGKYCYLLHTLVAVLHLALEQPIFFILLLVLSKDPRLQLLLQ